MSCPNNEATKLKTRQEDQCKENCSFNFSYSPNSSCILTNKGDYLDIKTDGKNNVTYNNQKIVLNDVRLYTPSLHTFDGESTDAELILKHAGANGQNIMVSVPIIAKEGNGDSSSFFSKIASYIPSKGESANVNVSNWSLDDILPAPKTPFYHYTGDSPYPPCNMQAVIIIFDKDYASTIKPDDLALIKKNIEPASASDKDDKSKEGFIGGMLGGIREGLVTYNKDGANADTTKDDTVEALECTEYYDTDGKNDTVGSSTKKTSNISIDWVKIVESPVFIIGIIIIICIIGWFFIKYGLPKLISAANDSKDIAAASDMSIKIPSTTGSTTGSV